MGRDGVLRFYEIQEKGEGGTRMQFLYGKSVPMCWVCRMVQVEDDFYVLGFNEVGFG